MGNVQAYRNIICKVNEFKSALNINYLKNYRYIKSPIVPQYFLKNIKNEMSAKQGRTVKKASQKKEQEIPEKDINGTEKKQVKEHRVISLRSESKLSENNTNSKSAKYEVKKSATKSKIELSPEKITEKRSRKKPPTDIESDSMVVETVSEKSRKKSKPDSKSKPEVSEATSEKKSKNKAETESKTKSTTSKKTPEKKPRKKPATAPETEAVAPENTSERKSRKKTVEQEPPAKKTKTDDNPMNPIKSDLALIDFTCDKLNKRGEKYNLKICSWNVSGIRALIKKNGMDYLKAESADIIALQETKCNTIQLPSTIKLPGYNHYFFDSEKSGYCGVALYCKTGLEPINVKSGLGSEFDKEGRLITAEFEKFYFINVYVPNSGQKLVTLPKRLNWNEKFLAHVKELNAKKPVVICGDLNVAHEEIDLANPKTNQKNAGFTKEEREGMTEFLSNGFVDTFRKLYPDQTGAYTFWSYLNNARAKNIGWRLDYYIVSETIEDNVCDNVIRSSVNGSDHCPIVLYMHI